MTDALAEQPRVIRRSPGRARVHLPGWSGADPAAVERDVASLQGVRSAQANARTANVLVRYDPAQLDADTLLAELAAMDLALPRAGAQHGRGAGDDNRPAAPPHGFRAAGTGARPRQDREGPHPHAEPPARARAALRHGRRGRRLRVAVRGIERDAELARRVVERLERRPQVVRAMASQLTGRVLVELVEHQGDIAGILADIAELEPAETPHDDVPSHPLDPAPLIQSSARLIGSALGLGLLALRRTVGAQGAPTGAAAPAAVAGAVGIVEGLPQLQQLVEHRMGHDGAQLLLGAVSIVGLTSSGGILGLAVAGSTALGLLTEVRARQAAWQEYEARVGPEATVHPGVVRHLRSDDRVPIAAIVEEGFGRAVGPDGATLRAAPGDRLPAGARVYGHGVTLRLVREAPFEATGRRSPPRPSPLDCYFNALVPLSLGYGALAGVVGRSLRAAFTGLLLVNPRAALTGVDHADVRASARALRCGVTVVGTRRRPIRRPDMVLIGAPRALTDGLEVESVTALSGRHDTAQLLEIAAAVAGAAGAPWGAALEASGGVDALDAAFDGSVASGEIAGERWTLRPAGEDGPPGVAEARAAGGEPLLLARRGDAEPKALIIVRPRLAAGIRALLTTCARMDVRLAVVSEEPTPAGRAVARRAGIRLLDGAALHDRIEEEQRHGSIVAVVADSADAGRAFAVADLAVGLTSGRSGPLPARADLLAPTIAAVSDILEAGSRRDSAVRGSVLASLLSNVAGALRGLGGLPRVRTGSTATHIGALLALAAGWFYLRGGRRPASVSNRLVDPRPERWGRMTPADAFTAVGSRPPGLTTSEAEARWRPAPALTERRGFRAALAQELRSPLIGALAAGVVLSLALGAPADAALIAAVVVANAAIGAWQEGAAERAAEALERMTAQTATVVRDGEERTVPSTDVVAGDVIVVGPGARVPADARVIEADALEVDEAALTGESIPVAKVGSGGAARDRVLLDGSDVVAGTGRALVVASGPDSRFGSIAAALGTSDSRDSPLNVRLRSILREEMPLIAGASAIVVLAGTLWGAPLAPQLALAAGTAVAAVPEGLPLLAGLAAAAVARRLAGRNALVRRLSAVESFGRVDVACTDKTGTITKGTLAVRAVSTPDGPEVTPEKVRGAAAEVLLAAALASPHPDAAHAGSHPTDVAVVQAAERSGLDGRLRVRRTVELPFESSRGFHAAVVNGRVYVKGAAEAVADRCATVHREDGEAPLEPPDRARLLERAEHLAREGLRVLMVAEGPAGDIADPRDLAAVGFVGIADPLRATVPAAVRRCRDAGVRVIMLTGDHPMTARTIARDAGLWSEGDTVLTGADIARLDDDELAAALDRSTVIARITPLDKVRIVEALRRRGHVVAMTGDGINDAPALRLADVGVAMGRHGTQVAREAADVVLADDDFSTLVEVLVEGRGFWANMRRSLAVLLGGNLGEMGLIAGAAAVGMPGPMTTRQVLAVNLVTDVLPAIAVAVQEPEHRDLGRLAREGATGLDAPLRDDILRRGIATAVPSLAAFAAARSVLDARRAQAVAFASVVSTQLAHTADLGRVEGRLSGQVVGAIAGSGAVAAAALAVPGLQGFFGLALPGPLGAALVVGATVLAVALARALPLPSAAPARLTAAGV